MTIAYNLGIPASGNNPSQDQPNMQTNNDNIGTYVSVDHVGFISSGDTGTSGRHKQTTFDNNYVPSLPTAVSSGNNIGVLFTNSQDGYANILPGSINQLFYYAGAASNSSAQYKVGAAAEAPGSTFLFGGIILKWGLCSAVADNASIMFSTGTGSAFPNNCFMVYLTISDPNATTKTINVKSSSISASGFSVRVSTGSISAFYLAIGN